jgi:hypothetical protein
MRRPSDDGLLVRTCTLSLRSSDCIAPAMFTLPIMEENYDSLAMIGRRRRGRRAKVIAALPTSAQARSVYTLKSPFKVPKFNNLLVSNNHSPVTIRNMQLSRTSNVPSTRIRNILQCHAERVCRQITAVGGAVACEGYDAAAHRVEGLSGCDRRAWEWISKAPFRAILEMVHLRSIEL